MSISASYASYTHTSVTRHNAALGFMNIKLRSEWDKLQATSCTFV